jgi:hypothetical protein
MEQNKARNEYKAIEAGDTRGSSWRIFVALFIGLIIGFGSAWLWLNDRIVISDTGDETAIEDVTDVNDDSAMQEMTEKKPDSVASGSDELFVKDQEAGVSVFISRASVVSPTWIAIHEDINGELGNVLGASIFDGGDYQALMVNLLRATEVGKTYYATLFRDNGDRTFDFKVDALVVNGEGERIIATFETYEIAE